MKVRCTWLLGSMLLCGPMIGCATHEGTDAAVGGLMGAGAGAIIGKAAGNTAAGALLGGGAGALVGAAVGSADDRREHREAVVQAQAAGTVQGPMTMNDVIKMTQSQVGEMTIIKQIQTSRTVFQLTPDDIVMLKSYGVTDNVINAMQDTLRRPLRPVVVYERMPPPPVSVGIGYYRRW